MAKIAYQCSAFARQLQHTCKATVVAQTPAQDLTSSAPPATRILSTTPPASPQQLRRVATRERGAQSALVRAQQRRRCKSVFRLQTLHHRAGLLSLRRQGSGSGVVKRAQALAGGEEEPEGCDERCC